MHSITRLLLLITLITASGACRSFARPSVLRRIDPRLPRLQNKIKSINLVNALNLSVEQMQKLSQLAARLEKTEDNLLSLVKKREEETIRVLRKFYDSLKQNRIPGPAAGHDIHLAEQPYKEALSRYNEACAKAVQEAIAVLKPAQLKIVRLYQPCVFPTQNLIDPARIGSAASGKIIARLDRLREMPDEKYQARRPAIIEKLLRKMRLHFHGRFDPERESFEINAFLDKVRSMSDVDWKLNAQDLVADFKKKQDLRYGNGKKGDPTIPFITNLLLNPDMIEVYESRIKAGGQPEQRLTDDARRGQAMRDRRKLREINSMFSR